MAATPGKRPTVVISFLFPATLTKSASSGMATLDRRAANACEALRDMALPRWLLQSLSRLELDPHRAPGGAFRSIHE